MHNARARRNSVRNRLRRSLVCTKKLGSISVLEPEDATNWWTGQQLPAPSKLIKVFVNKSRCFTLVDRGAGLDAAMRERGLHADGRCTGLHWRPWLRSCGAAFPGRVRWSS